MDPSKFGAGAQQFDSNEEKEDGDEDEYQPIVSKSKYTRK